MNIVFIKVILLSISHSLLYHLYMPYDLFLNESVFITASNFLLLAIVDFTDLAISRVGWEIKLLLKLINEQLL